mmetsp:Transcript_47348/g.34644  ORF Transcript_47348/g.34644 Transcript_47348/m.34644 type:complete len:133 (+) Transcript_47348:440-838(+)
MLDEYEPSQCSYTSWKLERHVEQDREKEDEQCFTNLDLNEKQIQVQAQLSRRKGTFSYYPSASLHPPTQGPNSHYEISHQVKKQDSPQISYALNAKTGVQVQQEKNLHTRVAKAFPNFQKLNTRNWRDLSHA